MDRMQCGGCHTAGALQRGPPPAALALAAARMQWNSHAYGLGSDDEEDSPYARSSYGHSTSAPRSLSQQLLATAKKWEAEREREALLGIDNVGPAMVGFVEMLGIHGMSDLARADAAILRMRINAHLGEPRLNTMGEDALKAMIATARTYLNDQG